MPTIREQLREGVLTKRDEDSKSTKFDEPVAIVRDGKTIVIPKDMRPERAVEWVERWATAEQQVVSVSESIDGVPIDAALALNRAVQHEFGVSELKNGFWGSPPPFISVPTSHRGENVDVYVGTMAFPGFEDATISVSPDNENLRLQIGGRVRQKDMPLLKQLFQTARRILKKDSLYKGKAFFIDLKTDEDENEGMVLPTFWNLEEDKPFIKEIYEVRGYNANSATHLCEITPSYYLPFFYADIVFNYDALEALGEDESERKREELLDKYIYAASAAFEQDDYTHCRDIDRMREKHPAKFHHYGEVDLDDEELADEKNRDGEEEVREWCCGNPPL